jgi:cytochrome P450
MMNFAHGYGPIAYTRIGGTRMYMLGDPALIEETLLGRYRECVKDAGTREVIPLVGLGLLTSEGELWKRNRKLASPPLSPKRIANYADTMVECTERMCESFRDGEVRDIHVDMMALTLEVVGKTLLGFDARGEAERIARILDVSMIYFDKQLRTWQGLLPKWVLTRDRIAFRKVLVELDQIVYGIIDRCRKSDHEAEHLLARLINARDEDGQAMSDTQLRDEAVTMLLAGHETTAIALSFAIYALSENPEIAQRLRDELDTKVSSRRLTLADLNALPYLDAVSKETLRLYPPAWAIGREVVTPFELGGYTLNPGAQIIMSPYTTQRDGRIFPEPERFKPERWLDGSTDDLPKFAYFPFGGGARVCIGNHFATMELKLLLGTLMQHVELKVLPGFKLKLEPIVTLRPKTGVKVRVHRKRAAEPDRAA